MQNSIFLLGQDAAVINRIEGLLGGRHMVLRFEVCAHAYDCLTKNPHPKMIITDLLSGVCSQWLEFIKKCKGLNEKLHIVSLVDKHNLELAHAAMESGCHKCIMKPFDDASILKAVESRFALPQSQNACPWRVIQ